MTQRKITAMMNRIQASQKNGYSVEALLMCYYLNIDLLRFILSDARTSPPESKKVKALLRAFLEELGVNPELKGLMNKKTLRLVKTWFVKMDAYFKVLKVERPADTKLLLSEAEQVCNILNISASKLFARNKT